jgi:hypothetical protein
MPKKPKEKKRKKSKPGPEEERLIISNPQAAIDALLKKKPQPSR